VDSEKLIETLNRKEKTLDLDQLPASLELRKAEA
jgi:hypothetical protein